MADANEFLRLVKRAALEAVEAKKPVNVFFGVVEETEPLKINVEQKMKLGKAQLVLARNVTDYNMTVTVDWESEEEKNSHYHEIKAQRNEEGILLDGRTETESARHAHLVTGKKQVTVHNALTVGDEVILIRNQGGQQFVVVDRIGGKV